MAVVQGVEHVWEGGHVALNACGMREGNRTQPAVDPRVLVTTDSCLTGPWIVRYSAERPERERDAQQRNNGGGSSHSSVQHVTVPSCFPWPPWS